MTKRKLALVISVLALVTILGVVTVGAAFAQTDTPPAQATPDAQNQSRPFKFGRGFGLGFGLRGGGMANFDAIAEALNLTPTQLFDELHSGKTLSEIAEAQGVDLSALQAAANASRIEALKDRIAGAVANGTITQEQADWLLQGLDKGYFLGGKGFGPGFGGRGHGRGMMLPGLRGLDRDSNGTQQPAPSTTGLGISS